MTRKQVFVGMGITLTVALLASWVYVQFYVPKLEETAAKPDPPASVEKAEQPQPLPKLGPMASAPDRDVAWVFFSHEWGGLDPGTSYRFQFSLKGDPRLEVDSKRNTFQDGCAFSVLSAAPGAVQGEFWYIARDKVLRHTYPNLRHGDYQHGPSPDALIYWFGTQAMLTLPEQATTFYEDLTPLADGAVLVRGKEAGSWFTSKLLPDGMSSANYRFATEESQFGEAKILADLQGGDGGGVFLEAVPSRMWLLSFHGGERGLMAVPLEFFGQSLATFANGQTQWVGAFGTDRGGQLAFRLITITNGQADMGVTRTVHLAGNASSPFVSHAFLHVREGRMEAAIFLADMPAYYIVDLATARVISEHPVSEVAGAFMQPHAAEVGGGDCWFAYDTVHTAQDGRVWSALHVVPQVGAPQHFNVERRSNGLAAQWPVVAWDTRGTEKGQKDEIRFLLLNEGRPRFVTYEVGDARKDRPIPATISISCR